MVVFCSLFLSNTLNQLARTAHNSPSADICFVIAGFHNYSKPGGSLVPQSEVAPVVAGAAGHGGMCGAKVYMVFESF